MAKDATGVTLHRTGRKYDRSDDVVFEVVQQTGVDIEWKDDAHLSVSCRCTDQDIRFQVTKKNGISIGYKQLLSASLTTLK
jgi:hypothetical protein